MQRFCFLWVRRKGHNSSIDLEETLEMMNEQEQRHLKVSRSGSGGGLE